MLNIRARPAPGAPVIGQYPPGARDIEVTALSPDGRWGRVIRGEGSGWVAMRFLARQDSAEWWSLALPLRCAGTEPFWGLALTPGQPALVLETPDRGAERLTRRGDATIAGLRPRTLGLALEGRRGPAFAVIRAESCSDGMSERTYGLSILLFTPVAEGLAGLRGCCRIGE